MDPSTLANLRRKRRYIHRQLDRLEPAVARLRASLDETNAAIQAVAPELNLPPHRYKPNPNFDRGELPRLVREIMRDADPLSTREIAVHALARKGVTLPGPGTMKRTRTRISQLFAVWGKAGDEANARLWADSKSIGKMSRPSWCRKVSKRGIS
jgi:hypothetical protein